jgi:hypothetical protein
VRDTMSDSGSLIPPYWTQQLQGVLRARGAMPGARPAANPSGNAWRRVVKKTWHKLNTKNEQLSLPQLLPSLRPPALHVR